MDDGGSQLLVTLADGIRQKERDEEIDNNNSVHHVNDRPVHSSWSSLHKHYVRIALMSVAYGGMSIIAVSITSHGLLESTQGWLVSILCLIVVVLTCVGIAIASRDRIFPKSQQEVFHLLLSELEQSTIRNSRAILRHAIFKDCGFVLIGGALTGISMCLAHFGMLAIITAVRGGDVKIEETSVVLAAIFAVCGSIICFLLLFRVVSIFPQYEWLKVVTCALFTVVTVGTYYLAHGSLTMVPPAITRTPQDDYALIILQSTCVAFSLAVNHWCSADMRRQIRSKMRRAATQMPPQQRQEEENSVIAELSSSIRFRSQRHRQVRVRPMTCISDGTSTDDGKLTSTSLTTGHQNIRGDV